VLETIEREGLVAHAREVGSWLAAELRSLPGVDHVRGAGLLLGVELSGVDAADVAAGLQRRHRVIVNAVTPTALRLCPPLVFSREDGEELVAALRDVLADPTRST
jgi:acetylornithine/N-succinyldiaminopimelate aminotransferase